MASIDALHFIQAYCGLLRQLQQPPQLPVMAPGAVQSCAECGQSLDDALILSCNHNLCLPCAGQALRRAPMAPGMGPAIQCILCQAMTEVDPSAAELLGQELSSSSQSDKRPQRSSPHPVLRMTGATLCGQCEDQLADAQCIQCEENFCKDCFKSVHRRGRMLEHEPRPLRGGGGPVVGMTPLDLPRQQSGRNGGHSNMPTGRSLRFVPCPNHPFEPIQFFCLECETECVCAECVVHGEHKGHDVLNVKRAYKNLCGKVNQLTDVARLRIDELGGAMQRLESQKNDISSIASNGRSNIREAFEQLQHRLNQKEADLLAGVDACLKDAAQQLDDQSPATEDKIRALKESQIMMRKYCYDGDDVQALNWYATAKTAMDDLLNRSEKNGDDPAISNHRFLDITNHLQQEFQRQVDEIATLGTQVGAGFNESRGGRSVEFPEQLKQPVFRGRMPQQGTPPLSSFGGAGKGT